MRIRTMPGLLATTVMLAAPMGSAQAAPVVTSDFDNTIQLDVVQPADCVESTEHLVGPERVSAQVVQRSDGSTNLVGDLTDDLVVEFSNGWTGVFTTTEHFAINTKANGHQVLTNVHRDTTRCVTRTGLPSASSRSGRGALHDRQPRPACRRRKRAAHLRPMTPIDIMRQLAQVTIHHARVRSSYRSRR